MKDNCVAINPTSSGTSPGQTDNRLIVELVITGLVAEDEQISRTQESVFSFFFYGRVERLNWFKTQDSLISEKSWICEYIEQILHGVALNVSG